MRAIPLSVGILAGALILPVPVPAMAQTSAAPPVGTLTPQGVPSGTSAETGARPGNDVGTGMSMPMGNRASNIDSQNTHSSIAPNLSDPALGDSAGPTDYLRAAQGSLAAGRTGEAQQALEMAQTRMLDRSVPYGQTNNPSDNPAVGQISQALRALAAGDRAQCMALIQAAIPLAR
ncbi:MAG: hypothetical protein P4L71_09870 [Acetobacteraceae bacterium]|nr:hypothetical protein [Acetobacteraceae bacterium]